MRASEQGEGQRERERENPQADFPPRAPSQDPKIMA